MAGTVVPRWCCSSTPPGSTTPTPTAPRASASAARSTCCRSTRSACSSRSPGVPRVEHLIGELDRDTIHAREPKLSRQLKAIADALTQVEAILGVRRRRQAAGRQQRLSGARPVVSRPRLFRRARGQGRRPVRRRGAAAAHPDRTADAAVLRGQPQAARCGRQVRRVVQVSVDPSRTRALLWPRSDRYPGAYFAMLRSRDVPPRATRQSQPERLGAGTDSSSRSRATRKAGSIAPARSSTGASG